MSKRLTLAHFPPGQDVLIEKCGNARDAGSKRLCKIVGAMEPHYLFVHNPPEGGKLFFCEPDRYCIVRYLHEGVAIGFRAAVLSVLGNPLPLAVLRYPSSCEEVLVREAQRLECNIRARLEFFSTQEEQPGTDAEVAAQAAGDASHAGGATTEKRTAEELVPGCPSLSLSARLADLSEGGCQILVPILDPSNREFEPLPFAKDIPPSVHTCYLRERLGAYLIAGEKLRMEFDLPFDSPAPFCDIVAEIRWVKAWPTFYATGVRFVDPPMDLKEGVEKLIEAQRKYFSPPLYFA